MLYNVPYLFEVFITISILAFVIYIWFNFKKENFSKFDQRIFSPKQNKELYNSDFSPRENILLLKEKAGGKK